MVVMIVFFFLVLMYKFVSNQFNKHFCASVCVPGVVSVSFEEDEEGNLCLIAYPLHSDMSVDLENKDSLVDCEPKSKVLKWSKMVASSLLVESELYGKDGRSRHPRKDKDKR